MREWTDVEVAAHNARIKAGRKGVLIPRETAEPVPAQKVRPRASVMAVGSTERGVMNKTEARFASEVLDVRKAIGEIRAYWYESLKLRLADGAWFTVDFFVMLKDGTLEAIEVKGHWRESARVRIKVAAERYPFRFVSVKKMKKKDGGGWSYEEF
jgi:hypothetical protein